MNKPAATSPFHPRNRHQGRYDFAALTAAHPPLAVKVRPNGYGELSVDFADPEAVMLLNQALLKLFYNLNWQLPTGYLTPPVPGRADYVHALADLLASDNGGVVPRDLDVMDIGCGANCIYPLIGNAEYGWASPAPISPPKRLPWPGRLWRVIRACSAACVCVGKKRPRRFSPAWCIRMNAIMRCCAIRLSIHLRKRRPAWVSAKRATLA